MLSVDSPLDPITLGDLEAVRLLLRGRSVIDWHRLVFRDLAEVDRFLRVNELDPSDSRDLDRMEQLRLEAVEYLERNFSFRIPPDVAGDVPVRELMLLASQPGRGQTYACIVLKVMHIIHHLAGRELLFKLPVSDDEVFHLIEQKVMRVVEEMRGAGCPIVEFAWSRKLKDSLVTKLLAKKESIAARVYDKLRFRLVLRQKADILPALVELCHRLIPFNYVIPGESVNGILPTATLEHDPLFDHLREQLASDGGPGDADTRPAPENEFSGPSYRIINFVADLPLRLNGLPEPVRFTAGEEYGTIIFVLTEFQVVDAATALENEQGENSHELYKQRQHERVKARLMSGPRSPRDRPVKSGSKP